jgi:hypothetical protein
MSDVLEINVRSQKVESPTIDRAGDGGVWRVRTIPQATSTSLELHVQAALTADLCLTIWTALRPITGQQKGSYRSLTTRNL